MSMCVCGRHYRNTDNCLRDKPPNLMLLLLTLDVHIAPPGSLEQGKRNEGRHTMRLQEAPAPPFLALFPPARTISCCSISVHNKCKRVYMHVARKRYNAIRKYPKSQMHNEQTQTQSQTWTQTHDKHPRRPPPLAPLAEI